MKRKHYKKKHNSAPPLTKLDKAIYIFCIGSSCVGIPALGLGAIFLRNRLIFSADGTIAVAQTYLPLLALPLFLFLFLSGLIFLITKKHERAAIFGDKKAKYALGKEPFFSKNKGPKTEHQTKMRRAKCKVWCAGLAICLFLAFPGVFPRTTLTEDYHLRHYNMFNVLTEEETGRFKSVELSVESYHITWRSIFPHWRFSVSVRTEEGKKTFRYRENFDGTLDDVLGYVENIVDRADRFTVRNAGSAVRVYEELNMTEEQIARFEALLARAGAS